MVPVYEKPQTSRRKKKPGARDGHEGARRKTPPVIDARVEHRLEVCPCCGGPVQRCKRTRTRLVEDIPHITPVVTEHVIHRDYCPACKKHVEPVVADAMPNASLGHNIVALSSWFHYGLGVTIGQMRDILASHLHTDITAGGSRWLAAVGRGAVPLVRADRPAGQGRRGAARRRDRLARGWPDALALVFLQ
jgi:transposase